MTQIVWDDSKLIGCGVADCPNLGIYYVCNFFPGGNYIGEFSKHVPDIIGKANDLKCKYSPPKAAKDYNGPLKSDPKPMYNGNCAASEKKGMGSFIQAVVCE